MHLKCLEKSFIAFLRIRLRRGVFIIAEITNVTIINVERVLPKGLALDIDLESITVPEIFTKIQAAGQVDTEEMWRGFNMGIRMVYVSSEDLRDSNSELIYIGDVISS